VGSKFGHTTLMCWHRFNQHYLPSSGSSSNGDFFGQSYGHGNIYGFAPVPPGFTYFQPNKIWLRPQIQMHPPDMLIAQPSALLISATHASSNSWLHDSIVSINVTSDAHNLQQISPFKDHDQIYIDLSFP
jgi:hypothetical protein